MYAVGDYTSGGQQYYTTTTTNYSNSPTSSGSHGANNYLPVDESLLTSRGDSPQTISGVSACEIFHVSIINNIVVFLLYRMCLISRRIHQQPQPTRNQSALPVCRMPLGYHRQRYVELLSETRFESTHSYFCRWLGLWIITKLPKE